MTEGVWPSVARPGRAVPAFAVVGLVDCAGRWFLGRGGLPSMLQGLVSPVGQGLFVAGVVWFTFVLLVEAAVTWRTGLSPRTARGILLILSVLFVALVARSGWSAYRAGAPLSPSFVVLAACALGILLVCAAAEETLFTRLPGAAVTESGLMLRDPRGRVLLVLAGIVVALPAAGLGQAAWRGAKARKDYVAWFHAQSRVASPVLRQDGVVLVVKFSDYQCPPCRLAFEQYEPVLRRLARTNPGLVKLVSRDFPLDPACNPSVHAAVHPVACEAAAAVRLARRDGGGAEALESWLFTHQRELSRDAVWDAAARLSSVRFSPDDYATALASIREDVELGKALAVDSTPTFFVNGVRLRGVVPPDRFEAVLREEARRLGRTRS